MSQLLSTFPVFFFFNSLLNLSYVSLLVLSMSFYVSYFIVFLAYERLLTIIVRKFFFLSMWGWITWGSTMWHISCLFFKVTLVGNKCIFFPFIDKCTTNCLASNFCYVNKFSNSSKDDYWAYPWISVTNEIYSGFKSWMTILLIGSSQIVSFGFNKGILKI